MLRKAPASSLGLLVVKMAAVVFAVEAAIMVFHLEEIRWNRPRLDHQQTVGGDARRRCLGHKHTRKGEHV